ncbi:hypothetical protein DACRYDRAFT_22848 [Dacryopinax primogenitus]|uniref:TMEM205-like domain-containing protein n=1 Tax=Dacryopinax primogenitus (strain DJM 731) TaxID=1858805 RepID=M5FYR1_DACPD|nr:uncharacterized protein DACRYDRAFT_22848 [Dacryopinax primogenitus]EJU01040.1 hypothetical protein DACRYDRAFT_22848 [Dacryopinax primogenitus]
MVLYSRTHMVSWALLKELICVESFYTLSWGTLFGMTIWVTLIGNSLAVKAVPREPYRRLTAKWFPTYFGLTSALGTVMLGTYSYTHPDTIGYMFIKPLTPDALQGWVLTLLTVTNAVQFFYIGPRTEKVMFTRAAKERAEGKAFSDPTASDELQALSEEFFKLHGYSMVLNTVSIAALLFHGLWIGTFGAAGY